MLLKPAALAATTTLLLTACAPAAAPAASPNPSPSPRPTSPSPVASPASSTASQASTPAGGVKLTLVPGASEARYRAQEVLAQTRLPNEAVGTTKDVSGQIALNTSGAIVPDQSKITVDIRNLKSDDNRRDGFLQRTTLASSQFPNVEFVPRTAEGLPWPLPAGGNTTFALTGDMTIKGVTRPSTWQVAAQFSESQVSGQATTSFTFQDFNLSKPQVPLILSVDDTIKLELDFQTTKS